MNNIQHERFMKRAIELSRRACIEEKSGGAFGAVIVKDNKIIAEGYNQVMKTKDPTWHAEIHAIREASKKLDSPHLDGCVLYTSAECCPMCLAAAYWAHIESIYFAATHEDSLQYGEFQDLGIFQELNRQPEDRKIKITELMRDEALKIWKEFSLLPDRARY